MSDRETHEVMVGEYHFGDKAFFLSGVNHERKRIIKLLEEYDAYINRDSLIALIKGENK